MNGICTRLLAALLGLAGLAAFEQGFAEATTTADSTFFIHAVAEKRVSELPSGPLFWRIEEFPSEASAKAAAGQYSLAATVVGRHWLFTLGPSGGATPGGKRISEIGPIPAPPAKTWLLRINHAGGNPGAQTPVHSHPGAEAIYVIKGQVTQRTDHGTEDANAGETLGAHGSGMAMQLTSSGTAALDQLVMFVVDADKPFSPQARFSD
jgi:hypothetical protein